MKFFIYIIVLLTLLNIKTYSNNKEWLVFDKSNSALNSNIITSLAIDKNNIYWVGSSNGLIKFDGIKSTLYDKSNSKLPNDYVNDIKIDNNNILWIATDGGLANFDGINWVVFNEKNSNIISDSLLTITIDNANTVWVGTDGFGLSKFDGTKWTNYEYGKSGMPDNTIWTISIDNLQRKWIGTDDGIAIYNDKIWVLLNPDNSDMPSYSVFSIDFEANNTKWIATDSGLTKFDGKNWQTFTKSNSPLPDDAVTKINIEANGLKWFCTNSGLLNYDGNIWNIFNTFNSGLPDSVCNDIIFDKFGNKIIATSNGLAFYQKGGVIGIQDPNKPSTPQNLTIKSFKNKLSLSWSFNLNSNHFLRVYRSTQIDKNFTIIKDSLNDLKYEDSSVSQGNTYYYRITAVNKTFNSESDSSNEVSSKLIEKPQSASNLILTLKNSSIILNWDKSSTPNIVYRIYRSTGTNMNYKLYQDNISQLSYEDFNILKDTTYYYIVRVYDLQNDYESNNSNEINGKILSIDIIENNKSNLSINIYFGQSLQTLVFENYNFDNTNCSFEIYNILGKRIFQKQLEYSNTDLKINLEESNLMEQIYLYVFIFGNKYHYGKLNCY